MSSRSDLDVPPVLLGTYLFEVASPAALESLVRHSIQRRYGRGEHVFKIGEAATFLHVVAEGKLKESLPTPNGDEIVVEVVQAGGICGEPGLFAREGRRIADLIALEPSVVVNIDKAGPHRVPAAPSAGDAAHAGGSCRAGALSGRGDIISI